MIRALRIKLVVAAMFSLTVVLTVILSVVAVVGYQRTVWGADVTLSMLSANDGKFPEDLFSKGDFLREHPRISQELPYESRYFSVFLSQDGSVLSANTGKIAAVDEESAVSFAESVLSGGKEQGFVGDYRYIVYSVGTETHIIFLDCGRIMSMFRGMVLIGIGVSLTGLLAVGLLLGFLSGRIVKPFSENYEKQKRFITDAGHELKTPLTIIDADTEVLEMDIGENEWLRDIQIQTKRLANLTNDLIFLSRMEESQARMEMIEFPLSDVAEETAEGFQALAKTHGKTLICRIQPMISLQANEKALRQLISILLDNAIKYSDEGGQIILTLEKQKASVSLSVFNTAQSVPRESLSHLFDRFYRTDASRNSQTGGYGLGLSIAQAVVSAHKGRITATTQDERSLQITAVFPL